MKKFLVILLLCTFSLLIACKKKINFHVYRASQNSIASATEDENSRTGFIGYFIQVRKCYVFKEYDELTSFLREFDLIFYNKDDEEKYSKDYFQKKALILIANIDSAYKVEYKFNLYIENETLSVYIKRSYFTSIDIEGFTHSSPLFLFYIELKKSDIENIDNFEIEFKKKVLD